MIDLFAGAGGLTAGFHLASPRFRTLRAVEMDLAAAASYHATFSPDYGADVVFPGPIEEWLERDEVPKADVIVGGPPCQGFSTLGKQDAEDSRNVLWRRYADTIVRAEPRYFVIENVAAFRKSPQFGYFADEIENGRLQDYQFDSYELNAADFGAAQARKRTVILGYRRDLGSPGPMTPTAIEHRTVGQALQGVPNHPHGIAYPDDRVFEFAGKTFAGSFTPHELHLGRTYQDRSMERIRVIPVGGGRRDLADLRPDLLPECWKKHTRGTGDVMGRLRSDRPSVTIRTEFNKPEKGRYLHPTEDRVITHYEAALLQGFPETHRFVGSKTAIAKQIGNAVPIPLGRAIAEKLLTVL